MRIAMLALSIVAASTLAGAAAAQVPPAIAAPGESAVVTLHAEGAQVYECKAGSDGKLAWAFREPIATLLLDGKTVGRHYAGPNWEHADGSAVVGKAAANVAGKTPSDIPWLKHGASRLWPAVGRHDGAADQHPGRRPCRRLQPSRRVAQRALRRRLRVLEEGLVRRQTTRGRARFCPPYPPSRRRARLRWL